LTKITIYVLTSKIGNRKREPPEKWVLRPRERLPIACMASTATAMFTSVISCAKSLGQNLTGKSTNSICSSNQELNLNK
jgi:hypothetical protein